MLLHKHCKVTNFYVDAHIFTILCTTRIIPAAKNPCLISSAPISSEMNTPSIRSMIPDFASFRCCTWAVPFVTTYCLPLPCNA